MREKKAKYEVLVLFHWKVGTKNSKNVKTDLIQVVYIKYAKYKSLTLTANTLYFLKKS